MRGRTREGVEVAEIARRVKDASPRWVKDVSNTVTRTYGTRTAALRPLPDFLVVGTKRGGTTSLWNYLGAHPAVLPMFPAVRGRKSTDYFFADCTRDEAWYRSHFHTRAHRARLARRLQQPTVTGEASPYYMYDPRICARIRTTLPHAKIIILLRDPVDRAYSHYQERVGQGVEPLAFIDALRAEQTRLAGEAELMASDRTYHSTAHDWFSYRDRGVYHLQVRRFLDAFAREQVLVLPSEDLYRDPQASFDVVSHFLGLQCFALPTFPRHNHLPVEPMEDPVRRELTAFFAPHNARLYELVGRDYGWSR